jgi:hypothetical protein
MKTPIEELVFNIRIQYGDGNDLINEVILLATMALEEEKEAFLEHGKVVLETYNNKSITPLLASEIVFNHKYE